jgi:hypothetical protein
MCACHLFTQKDLSNAEIHAQAYQWQANTQRSPLPNKWAFLKNYAVSLQGEDLTRCPTPQQGHNVTSLPVNSFKSSIADSLPSGTSLIGVLVSLLHSLSFVALFIGLSRP